MVFRPAHIDANALHWLAAFLGLIFVGLTVFLVGISVRARNLVYEVAEDAVVIAWKPQVRIPYSSIEDITWIEKPAVTKMKGSSLPALHIGRFTLRGFGQIWLYAGSLQDGLLVIHTDTKCYGVTPEDRERFIAEVSARMSKRR